MTSGSPPAVFPQQLVEVGGGGGDGLEEETNVKTAEACVCVCARARVLGGAIIMLIKDRCIHCSSVHSSAGINRIMSLFVLVQTVCLVQLEQHSQKMSHHNQFICPRCPTESTVTARHHFLCVKS